MSAMAEATPTAVVPLAEGRLDFSRCLDEAWAVYRRNFWALVAAVLLTDLLSLVTLFVLTGPLVGGWCAMTLNALSRPDRKVDLGLLFSGSYRFGTLAAIFVLTALAQLAGLVLLILPGLMLMTLWLFPFHLAMDKGLGATDAMAASVRVVQRRGLGPNFMLAVLVFLLNVLPVLVPYVGWALGLVLSPFGWLLLSAAYVQEVRENPEETADLLRLGFPIEPGPAPKATGR
jgi:hypothetical protein